MASAGAGRTRLPPSAATRRLRRAAIAGAGLGVLLLGVALLVVPIPGTSLVVIPLGLTILAREFTWARRLRDWSSRIVTRICKWTSAPMRGLFGPGLRRSRGVAP